MQDRRVSVGSKATLAILTVVLLSMDAPAAAQQETLYSFGEYSGDGASPSAAVTYSAGDLYGTTTYGGADNLGAVFKLTPKAGGAWTEKILYSFGKHSGDGAYSSAAVTYSAGDLYGTTPSGGAVLRRPDSRRFAQPVRHDVPGRHLQPGHGVQDHTLGGNLIESVLALLWEVAASETAEKPRNQRLGLKGRSLKCVREN